MMGYYALLAVNDGVVRVLQGVITDYKRVVRGQVNDIVIRDYDRVMRGLY
jgi:hypothetical protein